MALVVMAGCTMPEEKEIQAQMEVEQPTVMETIDTNEAMKAPSLPLPIIPRQRDPQGVYRGMLSLPDRLEQTVFFNNDQTFTLQEKYFKEGEDSIVLIEGTWAPSNGYIWLYKDQVVRARYKWKGETLAYYHPASKRSYALQPVEEISENKTWKERADKGVLFFGVGNEPFWNIEIGKNDSLSFNMADWKEPLRLKIQSQKRSGDSLLFSGMNDSTAIRVTILPYFCSDGMSDYVYRKQVKVQINKEVYRGCGMAYQR